VAGASALASGLRSVHANGATVKVLFTGLNNPRGLAFGPDGKLYVAEGGTGGTRTTTALQCQQVPAVGPYSGGFTARISRINMRGVRTIVARGLPSDQTSSATGGLTSGVAAVAFRDGTLYGLESAAGCSHGLLGTYNSIFRVRDGSTTPIANLSAFIKAHPTAVENPGDFEPDGTWYSLVAVEGAFYAVEPNHGEVDRVTISGHISRLIDVSAAALPLGLGFPVGHIVPTGLTFHNDSFYLTNLDVFDPGFQDKSRVFRITRDGGLRTVAGGLNAAVAVAFDSQGRLYALEAFTGFFAPAPSTVNTGMVVRLNDSGGWDTIASGLNFPTAMTFGPDGNLYVSNCGFGCPAGAGQILRIDVGH
jgi:DNA-binding beta-propeller fold protein YncE